MAKECLAGVATRSATVEMMTTNPAMILAMGMPPVDFGDDIMAKARAVSAACAGLQQ